MAQVIEKIVRSKYPPRDTRVLWLDANNNAIKSFINGKWESTKGVSLLGMMIETTYAELKEARDNKKLIPGQQYRITDYECTTSQENTKSAGHQFDIIVTADDEGTINEDARAAVHYNQIPLVIYSHSWNKFFNYIGDVEKDSKLYHCYESESHDCQFLIDYIHFDDFAYYEDEEYPFIFLPNYARDNSSGEYSDWEIGESYGEYVDLKEDPREIYYFASSNLSAWRLKYCLDNDTTRFKWAFKGGIEGMESLFSNGLPLKRCPDFDELSGKEGFYYAWGTDADIEDSDPTNFVYSQVEYPIPGDIVCRKGDLKTVPFKGKGVIYYMKDEWNNECPYDFKNILYRLESHYYTLERHNITRDINLISKEVINGTSLLHYLKTEGTNYYYTFSKIDSYTENIIDISTEQYKYPRGEEYKDIYYHTYDNEIKQYNKNGQLLNFICIISNDGNNYFDGISGNKFGISCHDITLCRDCAFNIFGNNCYNIFINTNSDKLSSNIFKDDSNLILMSGSIYNNNISGQRITLYEEHDSTIHRSNTILDSGNYNKVYKGYDSSSEPFKLQGHNNILLPGCLYKSNKIGKNNMFIKPGEEVI